MRIKLLISILAILLLSCKQTSKQLVLKPIIEANKTIPDSSKMVENLEQASIAKNYDSLGELVKTISFNVRTDNKTEFEDGVIPWANIDDPKKDLPNLVGKDEVVISENA